MRRQTLGQRLRSKASNCSYSKALLISTMRSARKLNSTYGSSTSGITARSSRVHLLLLWWSSLCCCLDIIMHTA